MKILHTSDWHLGQEFYSYDRTEEQEAFLDQIRDIVADERPDVMVVSGDIYHTSTPSNTVMKMFNEHIDRIRQACPQMHIVITAGNHDSSSRLEITRNLWGHLGVDIIGKVEKTEGKVDYDKLIIPIRQKDEICGYVIALPYIYPNGFPIDEGINAQGEERMKIFLQCLGEKVRTINTLGLPVVLMAHMAISGSDITGHDESRGGMDYVPISHLQEIPFDYLALGHIHCPQYIEGSGRKARYCGTPVPVSFDEKYTHSVSIVEIGRHGDEPEIRTIDIQNPWPILTLPSDPVSFEEAIRQLSELDPEKKAYIRLNVMLDDIAPANAKEEAGKAVREKMCRFCHIKWTRMNAVAETEMNPSLKIEEFQEQTPLQIARRYYQQINGQEMSPELVELFETVTNNLNIHQED